MSDSALQVFRTYINGNAAQADQDNMIVLKVVASLFLVSILLTCWPSWLRYARGFSLNAGPAHRTLPPIAFVSLSHIGFAVGSAYALYLMWLS